MPRPHCFLHENPKFAANQPQNFAMRRARIQRDSSRAARRVNRKAAARLLSASRQAQRRTPRVRFARTTAARLLSASRQAQRRTPRVRFVRAVRRVNRTARRGYFHIATGTAAHIPAFALSAQFSASIARPRRGCFPHRDRHSGAHSRVRFAHAVQRVTRTARRGYSPASQVSAHHLAPRICGAIRVFCRLDAFFRHLVP